LSGGGYSSVRALNGKKSLLEEQLKILGGFLSQEQIDTYGEQSMKGINMMAAAMKTLLPQKSSGSVN
jgi:hypothetical protein